MRALIVPILAVVFCTSCRTNDIGKYPLHNSPILYRTSAAGDAAEVSMDIPSPSDNTMVEIFTTVGTGIAGVEASAKLARATDPDSLAAALALGVQDALHDYFGARAVTAADSPAYIVEVQLEKYEIHSNRYGLYAQVYGTTRILQGGTAKLLWENDESVHIPLRRGGSDAGLADGAMSTAVGIFNMSKLLSMDDTELSSILQQAAEEAGRNLGEKLREDAAGD